MAITSGVSAGVAREDQVTALIEHGEAPLRPDPLHAEQVGDELHLVFHAFEPHEGVELGEQLVDRARRGVLAVGITAGAGATAEDPVAVTGRWDASIASIAPSSMPRNRSIVSSSESEVWRSMAATANVSSTAAS